MAKYPIKIGTVMSRVWEVGHSERTLVMIHDIGLRADWWRKNLKAFGDASLRAISFDLPGHGFADKRLTDDHSLEGYAVFVVELCRSLKLHRPILAGAGVGGQIAAMVACRNDLEVAGLVLAAPSGMGAAGARAKDVVRSLLTDPSRQGAVSRIGAITAAPQPVDDDWIEEEFLICSSPGAAAVFAALEAGITHDPAVDRVGERLRRVIAEVPTMIVWGSRDQVLPIALLDPTVRILGGAVRTSVIEGGGHACYFDSADDFNQAVIRFANTICS